jgi:hypothetical protein
MVERRIPSGAPQQEHMQDDKESETVEIRSTSGVTASVSAVVLREGDLTRLVFRPEMVDNRANPEACLRGTFIYQKRGKNEEWADAETTSLKTLKKGESYQLLIKSRELLHLMKSLGPLYRLYWRREGISAGRLELVKLEQRLATLVTLSQPELNALLDANQGDAVKTLNGALKWAASSQSLAALLRNDPDSMLALNATIGAAALQEALSIWEGNQDCHDESFWHDCLQSRPFLLTQLFHYPVVVIRDKVYVVGKLLDNRHGSVADFLAKTKTTGAAVLIEIKTPCTDLLANQHRQDVYPWSSEISGALSQVLQQRSALARNVAQLREDTDEQLEADMPRCVVLAGNDSRELDSRAKRRSFEGIRENLHGVQVIGFDELFERATGVLRLFTWTNVIGCVWDPMRL